MEARGLFLKLSPRRSLFALRLTAVRTILLLLGLLLALGPFTERFCGWDHFLVTGRDFEFTVLGMLLFCGLTLLAACKPSLWRSPLRLLRGLLRRNAIRMPLCPSGPALLQEHGCGTASRLRPVFSLRV